MADLTNPDVLKDVFTYHAPAGDDAQKYERIRAAALEFAKAIVANTPKCADQTVAIRHVRDAVFNANAAVALKGRV